MDAKTKYFWSNFLQGLLIAIGLIFLLAWGFAVDDPEAGPDYFGAIFTVGIGSTLIVIYRVAMDFTNTAFPKKKALKSKTT